MNSPTTGQMIVIFFPALTDLIQHASDEFCGNAIFAVDGVDPGVQQHNPATHKSVRQLGDRISADSGDPSAVLGVVDDIELPAASLRPVRSRAAMSAVLFSSRVAASASRLIVIVTLSVGESIGGITTNGCGLRVRINERG
jgi:hypothetical protein